MTRAGLDACRVTINAHDWLEVWAMHCDLHMGRKPVRVVAPTVSTSTSCAGDGGPGAPAGGAGAAGAFSLLKKVPMRGDVPGTKI